jgi:peptidyl-prolyl cis-trans isomerase C
MTMQIRTLVLGAALGSAMTLGFFACQKSGDKKEEVAKAGGGGQTKPALPPQDPKELAEPLAKIDGYTITIGEFQDRINKQSPYVRARYTSLEQKKDFLDNLIRFEVLAKEAKQRGLDQDAEVVRTMKQVMIQKLMKDEFETRVKPEDVTDAEMQKFYQEHLAEYNKPEEVRVSAIIVTDKAAADKAAADAKGPKGADSKGFRDLVNQYSTDDETKQRGGDLRYFAADSKDIPAEVSKAAFALQKTGDVAGPIKGGDKYYVIKQTGRRKAIAKTFDEVKKQIQNRIYRDKRTKAMEDFVANLRAQAKIELFEDRLGKVRIDTSAPPAMPPGAPGAPGAMPDMDPHGGMPMAPPTQGGGNPHGGHP